MIYLHTGQPGAGKTLFTLAMVKERAEREQRPVFYHGIEILKPEFFPNWHHLDDPAKWMDLPDGAIIVHDECQGLYRPRGNGSQVPEHVSRWETHRHNGWDAYLITQHPMLIDSNIRRLAGEHLHVMRAFGAKMATLHRWQQVKEQCDKSRADSVSVTKAYPSQFFDAYKSATVHTHKARIPPRVYFLVLLPLLLFGLAAWFYSWYSARANGAPVEKAVSATQPGGMAGSAPATRKPKTTVEWIAEQQPRIEGLPHTAPVFDRVTEVVRAPAPVACIASATRCTCYTDQGTRMSTPDALCRQIVKDGYFMAWDTAPPRAADGRARTAAPQATADARDRSAARAVWSPVEEDDTGGVIADAGRWAGVPPVGR